MKVYLASIGAQIACAQPLLSRPMLSRASSYNVAATAPLCRRNYSNGVQSLKLKRVLNHPPCDFYSVVSDVEKYSSFLPYCSNSVITRRNDQGVPELARLQIGWKHLNESYDSKLTFDETATDRIIIAEANDSSMFDTLYTKWNIKSLRGNDKKCAVELELRFRFHSALYNQMLGSFGSSLSRTMIEAFDKQAKDLVSNGQS